jgi:sugar phosphate isomerase/epimerase
MTIAGVFGRSRSRALGARRSNWMKLGFAAFQYIKEATKRRFYDTGRPLRDTSGRPVQFFTHHAPPADFDAADPLGWLIPRCRAMGCDAIEGSLQPYLEPAALDRLGNLLAKHGVTLATDYGDDLSAPKKAPEQFRAYARAARRLGVTVIGTGSMPFSINRFTDEPAFEQQMAMLIAALRPLVIIAEEEGVILALENHADYRCAELLEHVIRPIGSAALGIKLDTGNCPLVIEDPVAAAEASAAICYATHFKDMHISPVTPEGGKIVGAPVGRGSCQLDQVARILAERAPDPAGLVLSIEIGWMPPNEDYFQWLDASLRWCRERLAADLAPALALAAR